LSLDWEISAKAWIAHLGDGGDWGRVAVLDAPMLARVRRGGFSNALDVGCGEGRFCRMLQAEGIETVGIDPVDALLDQARRYDAAGDYRPERAEALPFDDAAFDLVVSYLTLIDILDAEAAITEMVRVLRPGGTLLIANLTSMFSSVLPTEWSQDDTGRLQVSVDDYLATRDAWVDWLDNTIRQVHRPLSSYIQSLLGAGQSLTHFEEPMPRDGDQEQLEQYRRVPWFLIMEWQKPLS
jgi:ubiquinone/menaquinone biosynthesis C-methylase UbiE